jgi:hypothetical protein
MLLLLLACGDVEGDEAGECSDGADNDQNGYFDCDDQGCWASPDCEGEADTDTDTDTDTDADADGDSDADTDTIGQGITGIQVDYTLEWDFIIEPTGVTDCVQTYRGEGSQIEAKGDRVTFDGTWQLMTSDCAESLDDAIWTPGGEHGAYTSLVLLGSDSPTHVETWSVHSKADGHDTDSAEFWISEMGAAISGDVATHEEEEEVPDAYLVLTHQLEFTLNP